MLKHTITTSASRKCRKSDAKFLEKDELKIKHGHIFTTRRAATVTVFLRLAKKPKHSVPAEKETPSTSDPTSNIVAEVTCVYKFEQNVSNTRTIQPELSALAARPVIQAFARKYSARSDALFSVFSLKDFMSEKA